MRATTHADLIELDAQKFEDVLTAFPMSHVGRYAEAYIEVVNITDRSDLDDTGEFVADYVLGMLAYSFPELTRGGAGPVATRASGRISFSGSLYGSRTSNEALPEDGIVLGESGSFRPDAMKKNSMMSLQNKSSSNLNLGSRKHASVVARVGNSIRGWLPPAIHSGDLGGNQGSNRGSPSQMPPSLFQQPKDPDRVIPF
jgi:hypothetical protein